MVAEMSNIRLQPRVALVQSLPQGLPRLHRQCLLPLLSETLRIDANALLKAGARDRGPMVW